MVVLRLGLLLGTCGILLKHWYWIQYHLLQADMLTFNAPSIARLGFALLLCLAGFGTMAKGLQVGTAYPWPRLVLIPLGIMIMMYGLMVAMHHDILVP